MAFLLFFVLILFGVEGKKLNQFHMHVVAS